MKLSFRNMETSDLIVAVAGLGLFTYAQIYAAATGELLNPYSVVRIPGFPVSAHRWTLSILSLTFVALYLGLRRFPWSTQVLGASLLTLTSMYTYDALWSAVSRIVRETGSDTPFIGLIALVPLLYVFHHYLCGRELFTVNLQTLYFASILVVLELVMFMGMTYSGFWTAMTLWDHGIPGLDPNMNLYWLLSKIPAYLWIIPLVTRRK